MNSPARKHCQTCQRAYVTEHDFLVGTRRWRVCGSGHLWFNCGCGSTLMIPKGKFDWYSPEKFLSPEAASIFNRLGNLKDLPHVPTAVMNLELLLQDPNTSPKALAVAMRKEPIIASQVIHLADNMRKSRSPGNPPITSLEHAAVYVGNKTLSNLVLQSGLKSLQMPASAFDATEFWEESYVVGAIAEAIVAKFNLPLSVDEVYLAASLANIGKLVIAFCFPPLATKIAKDVRELSETHAAPLTWRAAERLYQFPEHTILGEIAATMWGLPEFVLNAVRKHHDAPDPKSGEPMTISQVVGIAVQLGHWVLSNPHRIENEVLVPTAKKLGLDQIALEKLAESLVPLRRAVLGSW